MMSDHKEDAFRNGLARFEKGGASQLAESMTSPRLPLFFNSLFLRSCSLRIITVTRRWLSFLGANAGVSMMLANENAKHLGLIILILVLSTACFAEDSQWNSLIKAGENLYDKGAYKESEELLLSAVTEAEKFSPTDKRLIRSLDSLAHTYKAEGKFAQAEPLYKRVIEDDKKASTNHVEIATHLNNFGDLYLVQGRYSEAEPLLERSLVETEKGLGPDHEDVARILSNLASVYLGQRKYTEAEPCFERVINILGKTVGVKNPDYARALNNLGQAYRWQGNFSKAESLFKESLHLREEILGLEHPDVAKSLFSLAETYAAQGKCLTEAGALYKRAIAIFDKSGATAQASTCRKHYEELLQQQGR